VKVDRITAIGLDRLILRYFPREPGENFVEAPAEQTQEFAAVLEIGG
jgi:hypothetical protein